MPDLTTKTLLLIDGLGALTSAVFLGLLLPLLGDTIGMPNRELYVLAAIALAFAAWSLTAWRSQAANQPRRLRIIAIANLAYCALTAALVLIHRAQIAPLGIAYFAGEILIILTLVTQEWPKSA